MKFNSHYWIFVAPLITGTCLAVTATSWFTVWVGLEMNLLGFIPLMSSNNRLSAEVMISYFLVNAFSSALILFSFLAWKSAPTTPHLNLLLLISLFIKIGSAPFHQWLMNIANGMSMDNLLIALTWQKFAPLTLINMTWTWEPLWATIVLSALMGSLGGLNQTSLKKIMAFSSLNHTAWLLTAMMYMNSLWEVYFLTYSSLIISLLMSLEATKSFSLTSISMNTMKNKITIMILLLSLGGLPPLLGFLPKMLIMIKLVKTMSLILFSFLMASTLINLSFYLKLTYTLILSNANQNPLKTDKSNLTLTIITLTHTLLPMGLLALW